MRSDSGTQSFQPIDSLKGFARAKFVGCQHVDRRQEFHFCRVRRRLGRRSRGRAAGKREQRQVIESGGESFGVVPDRR